MCFNMFYSFSSCVVVVSKEMFFCLICSVLSSFTHWNFEFLSYFVVVVFITVFVVQRNVDFFNTQSYKYHVPSNLMINIVFFCVFHLLSAETLKYFNVFDANVSAVTISWKCILKIEFFFFSFFLSKRRRIACRFFIKVKQYCNILFNFFFYMQFGMKANTRNLHNPPNNLRINGK